jgi:hypothetical protein
VDGVQKRRDFGISSDLDRVVKAPAAHTVRFLHTSTPDVGRASRDVLSALQELCDTLMRNAQDLARLTDG